MAEGSTEEAVNLYQPKKRFLIPITNFHVQENYINCSNKPIYFSIKS